MNESSHESVNWGLICHLSGLTTYIGLPVVLPLAIWLWKRKSDAYANSQGREAVNFNISFTLYIFIAGLLCNVVIGYALLPIVPMVHVALIIWATIKANKRESVRYPLTLRVIA